MNFFLAAAAPPSPGGTNFFLAIFPYLLFFILFYVLFVQMPMRKKQKQFREMMDALKAGDRVVTTGGMYGVVTGLAEKTIKIRVANNVVVEMDKSAIAGLAPSEEKEDKKEK
jgi:preprotein translocase subunit YajC